MRLDIDVSGKSDRAEWGHAKYQTVFRPDEAYELAVEWLTASGSIVYELVCYLLRHNFINSCVVTFQLSGWHRKAQTCGLQMIPIPHDPLALPYSNKSDPLRGPIFVPLNIGCLEESERLFIGKCKYFLWFFNNNFAHMFTHLGFWARFHRNILKLYL